MKSRLVGDSALLVETAGPAEAQALRRALLDRHVPGLRELIPGQASLFIAVDPLRTDLEALAVRLPELGGDAPEPAPRRHEFRLRYAGEDLQAVAKMLDLSPEELVRRHTAPDYTVAFLGFAPGFAYLTGLDEGLRLPRRADPRTRVPAGSVALADGYTGIYPQATPGGWHIIGHCDAVLFDPARATPALLAPGDQVRFKALP
jgi:KipI family sensor histidine kinase inhibitor